MAVYNRGEIKMKKRLSITIICFFLLIICGFMWLKTSLQANFNPNSLEVFYDEKVNFSSVRNIVEDDDGNLYIGQNNNKCIQKFDSDGNHKATMGFFAKTVDFYVDRNLLLHVFYDDNSKTIEKIIDTENKKILDEKIISDDVDVNEIIEKYKSDKTYSLKDNTVYVKDGKNEYTVKIKDMPKKKMTGLYYFLVALICVFVIIKVNKKDLKYFDISSYE